MSIENVNQLANTKVKLAMVEEQITKARLRPASPERDVSIRSLVQTANQLKEEIIRFQSHASLKNAG